MILQTGGGPPLKEPSVVQKKIMKLFEGTHFSLDLTVLKQVPFDPFIEESDDDDMRPIPPSLLQEEIFIPDLLPAPARATPVLPAPSKKEKHVRTQTKRY